MSWSKPKKRLHPNEIVLVSAYLATLRGKNLACWCKPGAACHADVLLRLANDERHNVEVNRARHGA